MKIFLFIFLFSPLSAMIPALGDYPSDIDYELWYLELLLSNTQQPFDQFMQPEEYKKTIERFKLMCRNYKVRENRPIWITEIYNEPEDEQEPPSDNEDKKWPEKR